MKKIGTIRNIAGALELKSASVYEFQGQCILKENGTRKPEALDLTDNISHVSFEPHRRNSLRSLIDNTVVGFATGAGADGNKTIAGALIGVGAKKDNAAYITIILKDGQSLRGDADIKVASFLRSLSPQLTKAELREAEKERSTGSSKKERLKRFIDDAPRTYSEVEREIEDLSSGLEELRKQSENGTSFDERDQAKAKLKELEKEISQKKQLLNQLKEAIKVKKFYNGEIDYEDYKERRQGIKKTIREYQEDLRFPFDYLVFIVIGLIGGVLIEQWFFQMIFMVAMLWFMGKLGLHFLLSIPKRYKIRSLQKALKINDVSEVKIDDEIKRLR